MINNVLIYRWGSNSEPSFIQQLKKLNISCTTYDREMEDYHADSKFAAELIEIVHEKHVNAVFSFDYFPLISMICELNKIPYISWIYDCPMLTLQSKTLGNNMNYIYCFDVIYVERLLKKGAKHCFHLPLGGDEELLDRIKEQEKENPELIEKFSCDISFLGSFYNEKRNRYRNAEFSSYTKGFLEGIIDAQMRIYGYNFIKEMITSDIIEEVAEKCQLRLGEMYHQDTRQLIADMLNMEVSAREREQALKEIAGRHQLTLYTGSEIPLSLEKLNARNMGHADYDTEMPYIFHNSKININITSKSIESGIPLRIFDILSCGGFCLTNYQPEVEELFKVGKELVVYTDMEDLVNKVNYYLEHDEERAQIALNGYHSLCRHSLAERIRLMLQ